MTFRGQSDGALSAETIEAFLCSGAMRVVLQTLNLRAADAVAERDEEEVEDAEDEEEDEDEESESDDAFQ